jgi:hypothetical protein
MIPKISIALYKIRVKGQKTAGFIMIIASDYISALTKQSFKNQKQLRVVMNLETKG